MLRSVEELLDRYAAGQRRFRSVQLSAASLPGSELSNADFTGATFRRADLREVDFTGTVLRRASLRGANLLDANLGGADLGGADLRDTTLTGADLSRVDARCAELSFSRLRHADLVGADLRDVNFRQADLRRANLAEANLVGANLEGVTLDGADVQGAQIDLDALRSARLVLLSARWSSLLVEGTVLSREDVEFGESQPFDLEQPLRFSFRARGLTGTGIDALNRALRHASRASKSDLMTVNFGGRWGEDAESAIDSRARNPEDACLGLVFYVLAWRLQQRRLAGQRDGDRPLVLSGTPGLDSQCELVDALSRLELRRVEFRTPHDKQVFLQRAGALLCSANIAGYRSLGGGLGVVAGAPDTRVQLEHALAESSGVEEHLSQVIHNTVPPAELVADPFSVLTQLTPPSFETVEQETAELAEPVGSAPSVEGSDKPMPESAPELVPLPLSKPVPNDGGAASALRADLLVQDGPLRLRESDVVRKQAGVEADESMAAAVACQTEWDVVVPGSTMEGENMGQRIESVLATKMVTEVAGPNSWQPRSTRQFSGAAPLENTRVRTPVDDYAARHRQTAARPPSLSFKISETVSEAAVKYMRMLKQSPVESSGLRGKLHRSIRSKMGLG